MIKILPMSDTRARRLREVLFEDRPHWGSPLHLSHWGVGLVLWTVIVGFGAYVAGLEHGAVLIRCGL